MPPARIRPELHLATPEQIRGRGAGMIIEAGIAASPFGNCMIARCRHGFCRLAFIGESGGSHSLEQLQARWPLAGVERDDLLAAVWSEMFFSTCQQSPREIPLFAAATAFQAAVWRALLQVPCGARITYSALAAAAGHPGASRATGTAVGANPLAWLIPCHRVVRADGQTGDYRWGAERKRAMLDWEAAASGQKNHGAAKRVRRADEMPLAMPNGLKTGSASAWADTFLPSLCAHETPSHIHAGFRGPHPEAAHSA